MLGGNAHMKRSYPIIAFVCAALLELFLWHRFTRMSHMSHYTPPDSWYWQNLGLIAAALLLLAPVLRHGLAWQRAVAAGLCAFPSLYVVESFFYCISELAQ
jgi:hypothetical protein